MLAMRKRGRPIIPLGKLDGPGRPGKGIIRRIYSELEYPETKHMLAECANRGITMKQYFQELVREDRILKSGKAN